MSLCHYLTSRTDLGGVEEAQERVRKMDTALWQLGSIKELFSESVTPSNIDCSSLLKAIARELDHSYKSIAVCWRKSVRGR